MTETTTNPETRTVADDFVDVATVIPGIAVDLRYASEDNLFHRAMYMENRAFLRRAVAIRLREAQRILEASGVRVKVWDAYRPLSVQRMMWRQVPDSNYVAPPDRGSSHNRGAAVDVTLIDGAGRELPMGTDYDDFSPRAHHGYAGLTDEERRNRALLRDAMVMAGFRPISTEWWHFNDPDASTYDLSDVPIHAVAAS